MPETKIAITGLGAVSACGNDVKETLQTFSDGSRNAGKVTLFESALNYPVFALNNPTMLDDPFTMRTLNLAFQAAGEAILEAGFENGFGSLRLGICMGTTVASQLNDTDFYRQYRNQGNAAMNSVDRYLKSNLAWSLAQFFKISNISFCTTIVNACSS